jgi:hypothetical protein
VRWGAQPGLEWATITRPDSVVTVMIAADKLTLPPTKSAGGVSEYVWQPGPHFWAKVAVTGLDHTAAQQAVDEVRFDQSRICVVPFTLTRTPQGSTEIGCQVGLQADGDTIFQYARLDVAGGGDALGVVAQLPGAVDLKGPYDFDHQPVRMTVTSTYSDAQTRAVVSGITFTNQWADPAQW